MANSTDQNQYTARPRSSRNWQVVVGLLLAWVASICLALELKTLLTPGNFPPGTDSSFNISLAAVCLAATAFGVVLWLRGSQEAALRDHARSKTIHNFALGAVGVILVMSAVTSFLLYSANLAFLRDYKPLTAEQLLADAPRPDYSYSTFPTPIAAQPTPTYNPVSSFMAGSVKTVDGLRAGTIWISLTPDKTTVNFVQVFMQRILCHASNTPGGLLAVDQSEELINGPTPLEANNTFFMAQDMAVVQGVVSPLGQASGTVYLRYADPATNSACDLGSYDWSAALTPAR